MTYLYNVIVFEIPNVLESLVLVTTGKVSKMRLLAPDFIRQFGQNGSNLPGYPTEGL